MIRLRKSLDAWGTPAFEGVLRDEIARLGAGSLPLQQGLSAGSYASDENLRVMIIGVAEESDVIRVKAGLCYTGIIAGCSCADDPTPVDGHTEYCEVRIDIDKTTAEADISLLPD